MLHVQLGSSCRSLDWGGASASSSLRLGQVGQHVQLVEGQVELVQPVSRPERSRRETPDLVVGEVKGGEVRQLSDVLRYIDDAVVREKEPLQGLGPVASSTNREVAEIVV